MTKHSDLASYMIDEKIWRTGKQNGLLRDISKSSMSKSVTQKKIGMWFIYVHGRVVSIFVFCCFFNVDNLQMDVCVLCREIFCFILVGSLCLFVCLFDLGLTSLSTIFQSYRDGVWMWQGAQCSLLECCLTDWNITPQTLWHDIPLSHIMLTLSWPVLALLS